MKLESVDKNKMKLTFEVGPERFEEGLEKSYLKNRGRIHVAGFRKGKAPRKIIEVQYGKEVFFQDAITYVFDEAYELAIKEQDIDIVSRPQIGVEEVSVEKGVVFTAEIYVKPEVTVGEYRGVTYERVNTEATEEEIAAEIEGVRKKNARLLTITDRPAQQGDIVTIDFKGYFNDEPFEGGEGKDYELTIGSHTFVDTFEDQLVGANVGDDLIVNVTFPEEYHNEMLKGKPVKFEVEIKDIKFEELPELNDEFAQDVSEFDTFAQYQADIKDHIEHHKKHDAQDKKENDVVMKIVEASKMDIPDIMIENRINQMYNDFARQVQMNHLPVDAYLQYMGQTEESMRQMYRPNAESQVKARLVLETIAKIEEMEVTEDEIQEELQKIAESYQMDAEKIAETFAEEDRKAIGNDLLIRKALELVMDHAVEVEPETGD